MALSLADELGDELYAQLDAGSDVGPSAGLGQSLADELDLDLDLDHESPHTASPSTPAPFGRQQRSPGLRSDGLPLPRVTSGSTPRGNKASNTSTYYTAAASPGRLSDLDSADEVDQDLYELGEDVRGSPLPMQPDLQADIELNDAGLLTPAVGGDLLEVLQEQVDEQAQFRELLRSTMSETIAPRRAMSHSLNRSRVEFDGTSVDGSLGRYVGQMDEAVKSSEGHIRELIGVRRDLAGLSPFQLSTETVSAMLGVLDGMQTPSTPTSTSVVTPAESPSTPTGDRSHREFPFAQHDQTASHEISTAAHALIEANKTVMADSTTLSETTDHQQSFLTAMTRQIKGLKSTVASFKERDAAEDHARRVIEDWERSQVERGLRGERSTREVLDDLVRGFEVTVRECDLRMGELKAKSRTVVAVR